MGLRPDPTGLCEALPLPSAALWTLSVTELLIRIVSINKNPQILTWQSRLEEGKLWPRGHMWPCKPLIWPAELGEIILIVSKLQKSCSSSTFSVLFPGFKNTSFVATLLRLISN